MVADGGKGNADGGEGSPTERMGRRRGRGVADGGKGSPTARR